MLTVREEQILNLMKEGYMRKEIGVKLGLSSHTIRMEVRILLAKLDARNGTHAVIIALRRGLIKLGI